jgi:hypothetical protein
MNFNYFYIENDTSPAGSSIPYARPRGESLIDIYKDHHWQLSKNVDEVPSVILKEYKLEYGRWTASLVRMLKTVKSITGKNTDASDSYQNLYIGEPTGFSYRLPYVLPSNTPQPVRGVLSNTWDKSSGDVTGNLFSGIKSIVDFVGAGLTSGWGTEDILRYGSTDRRALSLSFYLYNTEDLASINDNFSFISLFYLQNLKTRTSWTTFLPPKVYSVDTMADGGIYMPMAYVENYDVKAIGQLRDFKEMSGASYAALNSISSFVPGGGRLIPEAYLVTITLREALPESTNIMAGALGGKKVTVIASSPGAAGAGQAGNKQENTLGSSVEEYALDSSGADFAVSEPTYAERKAALERALNTPTSPNPIDNLMMGNFAQQALKGMDPLTQKINPELARQQAAIEEQKRLDALRQLPGPLEKALGLGNTPETPVPLGPQNFIPASVLEAAARGDKVEWKNGEFIMPSVPVESLFKQTEQTLPPDNPSLNRSQTPKDPTPIVIDQNYLGPGGVKG